jgi:hypothetical protein
MLEEKKRKEQWRVSSSQTQKRNNTIKACTCTNRSMQRSYIPKNEETIPTTTTEAIIITGVIEAKQGRNFMTPDVPNAFVQMLIPENKKR